ncbi:MAG: hypothetical protein JW951_04985 [Lentisphaerae bacterium]|nr:hypothetical protein [Lentisphaerota bacterium]
MPGAKCAAAAVVLTAALAASARGKTLNGNDFALYYSEARTDAERTALLQDALGHSLFFRYLRIRSLEEGERDGRPYAALETVEPASLMRVRFTVRKGASLEKLSAAPASRPGDAVAVTGRLKNVSRDEARIDLDPVIVRHKDRLDPKVGKELLAEVDPQATYYSYTGGGEPVRLTYRDRDLLEHRDEILEGQGKQAWAAFLRRELAKRERERSAP